MSFDTGTAQLLSGLLGGFLAICGGIAAQSFVARQARVHERRSLAGAFAGEIAGLAALIEQLAYLRQLDRLIAEVERGGALPRFAFNVRHHYFRVFDANAARLGVLDAPLPELLVRYYVSSKVFLEDMEDYATGLRDHDRDHILERLRRTRETIARAPGFAAECLAEARRQAQA